jgi:hypothetical protein
MKILLCRMDEDEQRDSGPCDCCDENTPSFYIDTRTDLQGDGATWCLCEECVGIRGDVSRGVVLDTEDGEVERK